MLAFVEKNRICAWDTVVMPASRAIKQEAMNADLRSQCSVTLAPFQNGLDVIVCPSKNNTARLRHQQIQQETSGRLPVQRLAGADTPVGYAPTLEEVILPQQSDLQRAMAELYAF